MAVRRMIGKPVAVMQQQLLRLAGEGAAAVGSCQTITATTLLLMLEALLVFGKSGLPIALQVVRR